jgi:hypothetical protein
MLAFSSVMLQLPRTAFAGGAAILPVALGLDALLFGGLGCANSNPDQAEDQ